MMTKPKDYLSSWSRIPAVTIPVWSTMEESAYSRSDCWARHYTQISMGLDTRFRSRGAAELSRYVSRAQLLLGSHEVVKIRAK
jgi:hypothetical protein